MTDKQIMGGIGSAKPYTTLNTIAVILENEKLQEALKAKEQECEELKKKCNIYTCGICGNKEDCNKLYKTLTEIKVIAERDKEFCIKCNGDKEIDCIDCIEGGRALLANELLQKISECEGNND
jgi:hypothetical protein